MPQTSVFKKDSFLFQSQLFVLWTCSWGLCSAGLWQEHTAILWLQVAGDRKALCGMLY
jgi:hypothetical protein